MAVAQYPRDAGERPVRAGVGGHVAGGDWWTGPAGWRVGVAPVSRAAVRLSLSLLLKELAKARPPSPNCAYVIHSVFGVAVCMFYTHHTCI